MDIVVRNDKRYRKSGNIHRKYTIRQMEYNIVDIIATVRRTLK